MWLINLFLNLINQMVVTITQNKSHFYLTSLHYMYHIIKIIALNQYCYIHIDIIIHHMLLVYQLNY